MDTTLNIAPTAPEKPVESQAAKACPKKKGYRAIILLLTLLAAAGASASVFFYLDGHNQSQEVAKLKKAVNTYDTLLQESPVDAAMVQSLMDPYLVSFSGHYSVFESGLTEDAKAVISMFNTNIHSLGTKTNTEANMEDFTVYYNDLNSTYKKLFGSDKDIAEKTFSGIKFRTIEYDGAGMFSITPAGTGGAGGATISKIKDYTITPDEITVEMYHDTVPLCDLGIDLVAEDEVEGKTYCIESLSEENAISNFLEEHEEEMPVYSFGFKKDTGYKDYEYKNGRFVLKSLEKVSE